jgi:hypothetical protein
VIRTFRAQSAGTGVLGVEVDLVVDLGLAFGLRSVSKPRWGFSVRFGVISYRGQQRQNKITADQTFLLTSVESLFFFFRFFCSSSTSLASRNTKVPLDWLTGSSWSGSFFVAYVFFKMPFNESLGFAFGDACVEGKSVAGVGHGSEFS